MPLAKHQPTKVIAALFIFIAVAFLAVPGLTFVQGATPTPPVLPETPAGRALDLLDQTAQQAQIISTPSSAPTIYQIVGTVINIILGFLGVVFLLMVIYGGVKWMTAGGNQENIKKASVLIGQAAVGLAIVSFAFLLTNFIIFKVISVTTFEPPELNINTELNIEPPEFSECEEMGYSCFPSCDPPKIETVPQYDCDPINYKCCEQP